MDVLSGGAAAVVAACCLGVPLAIAGIAAFRQRFRRQTTEKEEARERSQRWEE